MTEPSVFYMQGWLVFIDSIVVYNTCRQNLPDEDPCHWGVVQNKSLPPGSVQPPQPFGGWKVRNNLSVNHPSRYQPVNPQYARAWFY
jgi:hypothetical protein